MSVYNKGKSFEREIVRDLTRLGFDAKRNWSNQFMKHDSLDIVATDGEITLKIQCKNHKKPNMHQAYREAKETITGKKDIAMGMVKYSSKRETYCVISWKDMKRLIRSQ